jgi:hypothetical protein
VGPRAGLDDAEKRKFLTLPGLELLFLGRPARSQSLYRLHHPGSSGTGVLIIIKQQKKIHCIYSDGYFTFYFNS